MAWGSTSGANLKVNKKKWELLQKELIYLAHNQKEIIPTIRNELVYVLVSCPDAAEFYTLTQHVLRVHQHSDVSRSARQEGGNSSVVSTVRSSTISIKRLALLFWLQNPFHHVISWACKYKASSKKDLSFPGMLTIPLPKNPPKG